MTRSAFMLPAAALLLTNVARASGRKHVMALDAVHAQLHAARSATTSIAVRHIGAYVSLLTAVSLEQLANRPALATSRDAATIAAFFEAIDAAVPAIAMESTEQRWSVTCHDAHDAVVLVVTSSIFVPRDGTIGGRRVLFHNDHLVEFLAKQYAPNEVGASSRS